MRYRIHSPLLVLLVCLAAIPACEKSEPKRAPDVPWDPTPMDAVAEMLRLADVNERDIVYDLGSGDGRIVIAAARDFGARGVGIDIDPELISESVQNAKAAGVTQRVRFREEDLFEADIQEATVVTLFLWPSLNLKLQPRLLKELKPGTRIVSYLHKMGDWQPEKKVEIQGRPVYVWIIPHAEH